MTATSADLRLTQYAAGGGCACKVPPGELERVLAGLPGGRAGGDLLVGVEHGDDGAAVRIDGGRAVIATADFFTPVVDDAYDWGRIAAANALSDVYAMGGEPLLAINLLAWPRDLIPFELAASAQTSAPPRSTSPVGTASMTGSPSTAWRSPGSPTPTACCATTAPPRAAR